MVKRMKWPQIKFRQIAGGENMFCAVVHETDELKCWGKDRSHGELDIPKNSVKWLAEGSCHTADPVKSGAFHIEEGVLR
jgi:hypothetical protein